MSTRHQRTPAVPLENAVEAIVEELAVLPSVADVAAAPVLGRLAQVCGRVTCGSQRLLGGDSIPALRLLEHGVGAVCEILRRKIQERSDAATGAADSTAASSSSAALHTSLLYALVSLAEVSGTLPPDQLGIVAGWGQRMSELLLGLLTLASLSPDSAVVASIAAKDLVRHCGSLLFAPAHYSLALHHWLLRVLRADATALRPVDSAATAAGNTAAVVALRERTVALQCLDRLMRTVVTLVGVVGAPSSEVDQLAGDAAIADGTTVPVTQVQQRDFMLRMKEIGEALRGAVESAAGWLAFEREVARGFLDRLGRAEATFAVTASKDPAVSPSSIAQVRHFIPVLSPGPPTTESISLVLPPKASQHSRTTPVRDEHARGAGAAGNAKVSFPPEDRANGATGFLTDSWHLDNDHSGESGGGIRWDEHPSCVLPARQAPEQYFLSPMLQHAGTPPSVLPRTRQCFGEKGSTLAQVFVGELERRARAQPAAPLTAAQVVALVRVAKHCVERDCGVASAALKTAVESTAALQALVVRNDVVLRTLRGEEGGAPPLPLAMAPVAAEKVLAAVRDKVAALEAHAHSGGTIEEATEGSS